MSGTGDPAGPLAPGGSGTYGSTPAEKTASANTVENELDGNAIGADVVLDQRDSKKAWIDDVARYSCHGVRAPLTLIPGIGDTAQRMVDAATYEWSKDVKAEADQIANVGVAKETGAKAQGSHDLINQWAGSRGRDPMTDSVVNYLRDQSDLHYSASRNQALADLHRGLS
ncbi:hypothetical protein HET69_39050 [Streptomyces sp. CJ_13]|uniref:hypothetical protein n=1 Tax=Streptomyces sp. CJ_13 TaxID=2724943 RepID=UPI001BDD476F|nr:hypothetical protein [Streptomyces sp. CJ_13]MBT1189822.1 hypothetical protein [Streptomyces sp. CJ_13]